MTSLMALLGSFPLDSLFLVLGSTAWHEHSTKRLSNSSGGEEPVPWTRWVQLCQHGSGGGWPPLLQGHTTDPVQLVVQQHPGLFGRGAFLQASGTSPSLDLSVMADSSFMMTQDNSLRGLQCVLSGPIDQLILKDPNSMLAYCGCSLPPPSFASRPETEQTDSKACSVMEQCIHLSGFPSHFHC